MNIYFGSLKEGTYNVVVTGWDACVSRNGNHGYRLYLQFEDGRTEKASFYAYSLEMLCRQLCDELGVSGVTAEQLFDLAKNHSFTVIYYKSEDGYDRWSF